MIFYLLIIFSALAFFSYFRLQKNEFWLGLNSTAILYIMRALVRPNIIAKTTYIKDFLTQEGGLFALIWGIIYYMTILSTSYFSTETSYEMWESIQTRALVGTVMYAILFGFIYTLLIDGPFEPMDVAVNSMGFLIWYSLSFGLTNYITS